jgi:hypothetical protein
VCDAAIDGWNQGAVEWSTRIMCGGSRQFWGRAEQRDEKRGHFGPNIFINTPKKLVLAYLREM